MSYHIEINNEAGYGFDVQRLQLAITTVLMQHTVPSNREIGVEVVNNRRIQELNRNFRQVNKPTDVLSFPAQAEDLPDVILQQIETLYLGDLAIAYPYASDQAKLLGCSIDDNLALLAIHGTLHLLNYDHDTPSSRAEMWAAQDRALSALGIPLEIVPALEDFAEARFSWSRWLAEITSTMFGIRPCRLALHAPPPTQHMDHGDDHPGDRRGCAVATGGSHELGVIDRGDHASVAHRVCQRCCRSSD
jgi:probable rRNA maturation factor